MLATAARRKNGPLGLGAVGADVFKIAAASVAMAAAIFALKPLFAGSGRITALASEIAAGAALYATLVALLMRGRVRTLAVGLWRRRDARRKQMR